jgi:hypothetical protein
MRASVIHAFDASPNEAVKLYNLSKLHVFLNFLARSSAYWDAFMTGQAFMTGENGDCPPLMLLDNSEELSTFPFLTGLPALQTLWLDRTSLMTPPDLSGLTALKIVGIMHSYALTKPPILAGLAALEQLWLDDTSLATPPILTGLHALKYVSLENCTSLTTPPDCSTLPALSLVMLSGCTSLPQNIDMEFMNAGVTYGPP